MKKDNIIAKKEVEDIKWSIAGWIRKRHPRIWKVLKYILGLGILGLITFIVTFIVQTNYRRPGPDPSPVPQPVLSGATESSIQSRIDEEKIKERCKGAQFDILDDLEVVGNERFFQEETGVSARNTEYHQASAKTQWGCKMPFVAGVVLIPIKGSSLGVFLEYENVFRVLVGDGDRETFKVEQNKWGGGTRGTWQPVPDEFGNKREKLGNPIADGEEVIVTVKANQKNGEIFLRVEVYHSKLQSSEIYNYYFSPNAVNFQVSQERKFRVGINDFRFKGAGSTIDLISFFVEEREW